MKNFITTWGIPIAVLALFFSLYIFGNEQNSKRLKRLFEEKPYVSYENNNLFIEDFDSSYGIIEINKASNDLNKLDQKVFEALKGKTGKCSIYLKVSTTDRYGNTTLDNKLLGEISVDELSKYKDWEHWKKAGGITTALEDNRPTALNLPVISDSQDDYSDDGSITENKKFDAQGSLLRVDFYLDPSKEDGWRYYFDGDSIEEITHPDARSAIAYDLWKESMDEIKGIKIEVFESTAHVKIEYDNSSSDHLLRKVNKRIYAEKDLRDNSKIFIDVKSTSECAIYLMKNNNKYLLGSNNWSNL